MKKILRIESSVNGTRSLSRKLTDKLIETLSAKYKNVEINSHDFSINPPPHLEPGHIESFLTPVDQHTDEHKDAIKYSNLAIKEIQDADIIVIGVPIYNFTISSTLKSWMDHIVRRGITFSYTEAGPEGLLKGKKVYLAISSGGMYTEGAMKNFEFAESYLRFMFGFIGLTDIETFRIEGVAIPSIREAAVEKGIALVEAAAF